MPLITRRNLLRTGIAAPLVMRPRRLLARTPSLGFPGGVAPGVNPNHPVANNGILRFSGVSFNNGNFFNLLTSKVATRSGTVGTGMFWDGPGVISTNSTSFYKFTGQSTATDSSVTVAAIWTPVVSSTNQNPFASFGTSSNGGFATGLDSSAKQFMIAYPGGSFVESSYTFTGVNVPIFIAASSNASATKFVLRRLDNGEMFSSQTGGLTYTASSDATYQIGNGFGHLNGGHVCAAMYSSGFNGLGVLQQWALDPWSFWYPPLVNQGAL